MKTLTILILGLLSFLNFQIVYGQTYDYLESATTTHTATTVNKSTAFTDLVSVSIDVGTNTTESKYVLVAAGINMRPAGSGTGNRRVYYNISFPNAGTESGQIDRLLIANNESGVQNWGVGTLVHIFDVSGLSGNQTFTLKHQDKNGVDGNNIESSVNLTAVALSTKINNYKLNNDVKRMSSSSYSISTIFVGIGSLTTNAITLPIKGDVYVSASINVGGSSPGSVAEYQLQSSDDDGNTWSPLGKPVQRSMMTNYDDGIVSLVGLLQGKDAGDYKFRLAHRRVSGTGNVNTHNVNLVAVALAHSGGGYFPSFYSEVDANGEDITGITTPAATVTSSDFTAAADISSTGTNLFVNTQYLVSASGLDGIDRMRAGNQLKVSGASSATAQEYYRYIPNNSNLGAGGFIGLMEDLVSNGSYAINMEHQIVAISGTGGSGDETLKTSQVILCGFQTYDQPSYNWNGSTNTDWATATNWSSGSVPGASDNVAIPDVTNAPIIAANALCNNAYIGAGGELTVATGGVFQVNNTLSINSDASSNGSLIVNGNLTGTVTYKRYMTGLDKWHLISSPVDGQDINTLVVTDVATNAVTQKVDKYALAPYNNSQATPSWEYYTTGTIGGAGNLLAGKGYELLRTSDGTVSFTGAFADGDKNIAISIGTTPTSTTNAWNLVGNPYTSAICANNAATTATTATENLVFKNVGVLGTGYEAIYVWDAAAAAYVTVNHSYSGGAYYIAPGQAFFVNSLNETGSSFQFTEAMQTHQTGDIFKSGTIANPAIKLFAERSEGTSSTNIKYIEGQTTGLDPGYDAGRFSGVSNSFAVYTHLVGDSENTIDFDIQCLPANAFDYVVPVGLNAPANTEVVFSAQTENLPSDIPVYLEDKLKGTYTALHESGSFYAVSITEQSEGIGRFYLHTKSDATGILLSDMESAFTILPRPQNNSIRIIGKVDGNTQVAIYDIAGRQLANSRLINPETNDVDMTGLNNGVYIVNISSSTQKISKKMNWVKTN